MRLPVLILAALVAFAALYALGGAAGEGDSEASAPLPERLGSAPADEPISLGPPTRLPSAVAPAEDVPDEPERPAARAPSPSPAPAPAPEPAPQEDAPQEDAPAEPAPEPAPRPDSSPRPPSGAPPFSDVE